MILWEYYSLLYCENDGELISHFGSSSHTFVCLRQIQEFGNFGSCGLPVINSNFPLATCSKHGKEPTG
jgi:hypothetical protein